MRGCGKSRRIAGEMQLAAMPLAFCLNFRRIAFSQFWEKIIFTAFRSSAAQL